MANLKDYLRANLKDYLRAEHVLRKILPVENSDDLFFNHHLFLRFPTLAHVTNFPAP